MRENFWNKRRVFLTGHTGFKGAWLSLWLTKAGAEVTGYALKPPTNPSLFELCKIDTLIHSVIGDVRDEKNVLSVMQSAQPEIVIHMAAQPLVRDSYKIPVETYTTNVMGTVHILEAVRKTPGIKAVVNVTTDKCYENKEWLWGYRETEPMGGYDPYSSSKACSELVSTAYRNSYFPSAGYMQHGVAVATARAGNVIGGGDWANDRLIPDIIQAMLQDREIVIRNPHAIRPWQHVLEPLHGYMILAQRLYEEGCGFAEAWNFGPNDQDAKSVGWIVEKMCQLWAGEAKYRIDHGNHLHEANYLKLDCAKAKAKLGWCPVWNIEQALAKILDWVEAYQQQEDLQQVCFRQIDEYMTAMRLNK